MSTLLEDLQALLNPLVQGGAWPLANEMQPPTYPYIVFGRITSPTNVNLSGPSDLQNTRLQIDIFAKTMLEADSIARSVDAAFQASGITHVSIDSRDVWEEPVRAYRISRDYSIWARN